MQILAIVFTFLSVAILVIAAQRGVEIGLSRCEARYRALAAESMDTLFLSLPPRAVTYLALASSTVLCSVCYLATHSPLASVIAACAGLATPQAALLLLRRRRARLLMEQLPDTLSLASNSMRAGLSLQQTFTVAARELLPPMSQEMAAAENEFKLGVPLETALEHLRARLACEEADLAITAILISHEVGGNLPEALDRIAISVRERLRISGRVSVLTAQGRMQAVVMGTVPFGVAAALFKIDPALMRPLTTTPEGWAVIALFLSLEAAGCMLLRKMVRIDA